MREFRYFRINTPTDKKDGLLIFGVRDLRRLDKCILDLADNLDDYLKIRKNLNDYYLPRRNKQFERNLIPKTRPTPTPGETTVTVVNGPISPRIVWVPRVTNPYF